MLLKQTSLTGFFSLLFATILTFLLRHTEHLEPMIYWVGINLLMVLTREIFIYPNFRTRRQRGESHFRLIHGVIVFFWLFAGLIWGIGGYLFLPQENQPELVIIFITTYIGLTVGNIISFAPSIWAGVAFTVPAILSPGGWVQFCASVSSIYFIGTTRAKARLVTAAVAALAGDYSYSW